MAPSIERRLRAASTSDDEDELVELGCLLADDHRLADAEGCFRRAADLGSAVAAFNLGNCLAEQERWLESAAAYETALERGEADAWLNLGHVRRELGDLVGGDQAFEEAEAAGDSNGTLALAFSQREGDDRETALATALRAAAAGNETAAAVVACWQWCSTLDPALEPALRAGAGHFPAARSDLADLLKSTGRVEEAQQVLELGMKLGEVESMIRLGNQYWELGDDEAAERAYRAGADSGDPHSHHNLAVLLADHDDPVGAEMHFRLAIQGGDTLAVTALRELLEDQ